MALTTGLQLPYGVQPVVALPTDTWSGPYLGATEALAMADANATIPSGVRFKSMEVRLIINGESKKYWYANGILDTDLKEFSSTSSTSLYTYVNSASANWDSVYTSFSANSADYATFNYVDTNFLNLTGGTIDGSLHVLSSFNVGSGSVTLFVSGGKVGINTEFPDYELSVNGSLGVSEKIYGTIIDWMTLTRGYKTTPTLLGTATESGDAGDVYEYIFESSPSDITYYRFISTNGQRDEYYANYITGTLSNLITKKKIIL